MAINQDILNPNTNWEDQTKGYIEDGLKELLRAMLAELESPTIAAGSVGVSQLTQALRDIIDGKVPNTRKVNNKPLSSDVTIGAGDINVDSNTTLAQKLAELANAISSGGYDDSELRGYINDINGILDTQVVKSISVNGQTPAATPDTNGNVNIQVQGGLTKEDISVETQGDGTVDINVGSGANKDTYTVNLNHTHENMAKLIVCEESDLPSTLSKDTIYAQVDDADNPSEIEVLYIAGVEFAGGGAPAGTPVITRPSGTTLNLGTNDGSGVSAQVEIKGRNLTGDLTVTVGTGLTVTYNGTTASSVTIPLANALAGAQVTIAYSGSGALDDGSLVITGGGASPKSVVVVVVEPYVTDGLVFHLDGADASTSQWVDRIGGIAFMMNNVTLDGHGGVVFNGTDSYGRYSAASSLGFKPHTHTIEVVANIEGTATSVLFMQNNESDLAFGITGTGTLIACSQTDTVDKTYQRRVQNVSRGLMSFSFANNAAYKNKTAQTVDNNGCFDPTANAGVFIGARDTTRSFLQGTIYQIRVYNRLLTSAEILANQQSDIERYNIQ